MPKTLKTQLLEHDGQFWIEPADQEDAELIRQTALSLVETSIDHVDVLINSLNYLVEAAGVDQLWLWIPTRLAATQPDWLQVADSTDYRLFSDGDRAWLRDNNKLEDRSHTYPETTESYAPMSLFVNMLGEVGAHYGGVLIKVMADEVAYSTR